MLGLKSVGHFFHQWSEHYWDEVNNKSWTARQFQLFVQLKSLIDIPFLALLARLIVEFAKKKKTVFIVAEWITRECSGISHHIFLPVTMWGAMFLWEPYTSPPLLTLDLGLSLVLAKKNEKTGCHAMSHQQLLEPLLPPSLLLFLFASRMTCHKAGQLVHPESQHRKRVKQS